MLVQHKKISQELEQQVKNIKEAVLSKGDQALFELTARFDGQKLESLAISEQQIALASQRIPILLKQAIKRAKANIERFHKDQLQELDIETQSGVRCQLVYRPIESVGLYIPGGSAPLFSTVLMLAIPAKLAGCSQIILCSPPPIADEILYTAKLCGIEHIYALGGAQAVFALAYGSQSIPQVDKIFGPGNAFVTEAKRQIMQQGYAIDMPAGPSELLVIADQFADPAFVASDLLSQAEHGPDSQVILVTPSQQLAQAVTEELTQQLKMLARAEIASKALQQSRILIAEDLRQAVAISNSYAPEHLIVQTQQPRDLLADIQHAGSVFLGAYAPESMGDYASGTNHVLPTYGYSKTYSSLGLADFCKRMTVQQLTSQGFKELAPWVEIMAQAEQLDAHKMAVSIRLKKLQQNNEHNSGE